MAVSLRIQKAVHLGFLSNQGEKRYKLVFHNGYVKKKVLKYGTPKARHTIQGELSLLLTIGIRKGPKYLWVL